MESSAQPELAALALRIQALTANVEELKAKLRDETTVATGRKSLAKKNREQQE